MQRFYESSLERCKQESNADESYYSAISVTTTYNLSRLHESLCEFDKAEALYKNILREHPNYVDCKSAKILMNVFNYFTKLRIKGNFWSLKCWFCEIDHFDFILLLNVYVVFSWWSLGKIRVLLTLSWSCWIFALLQICMKDDGEYSNDHVCTSGFTLCWICFVLHSLHIGFSFFSYL